MKKIIMILCLIPALSWAQNSSDQKNAKAAPTSSPDVKTNPAAPQPQAQEENKNAVKNDYPVGPFDKDGKYNFLFDKKDEGDAGQQ